METLNFNPRLREGGDHSFPLYLLWMGFQSTPPRRRRPCFWVRCQYLPHFNPRLREGGDVKNCNANIGILCISIHASAKEATLCILCGIIFFQFQSTPPRRRRLGTDISNYTCIIISIHASAKEANV